MALGSTQLLTKMNTMSFLRYFDVCTMHFEQFIFHTNKRTIYIYIVSTVTCFDATTSSSGSLKHMFAKVTKILKSIKITNQQSSRL